MYANTTIQDNITGSQNVIIFPIERNGVYVYVDSDPDYVSPDFVIDPADEKGIAIFREFAAKMAAHYKSLKDKSLKNSTLF